MSRPVRRSLLASTTAVSVALTSALLATSATAAPSDPSPSGSGPAASRLDTSRVKPTLSDARKLIGLDGDEGQVTAIVQLATEAGVEVADKGAKAVRAAAAATEELAEDVVPAELTAKNAGTATPKRLGTLTNLMAGTLVTGDAAKIAALAKSDDVTAVYRVATKRPMNSGTVDFTSALQTWQDAGATGSGVSIAIIDTGLDYTHRTFGGEGTQDAYDDAYGEDGTQPVDAAWFDATKYAGGYDFAGPLYDASLEEPGSTDVPAPDENPIDSLSTSPNSGHGTHVAGTAGGYGVDADGSFEHDYATLTDVSDWKVGPGSAPLATLWGFKVFGDIGGSTNLTALALDRAADPNGDGDLSDHVDVVNMSLGSDGSPADDPDNVLVDQLTKLGVVVVVASGNAGDTTDIGGAPGNAASSLTVANSVGTPVLDATTVVAASDEYLVGQTFSGQNSIAYAGGEDVTAPVAFLGAGFDGCSTFTADQAEAVAGKIAYLYWDETPARRCGSAARFINATQAGAVGVLMPTDVTVFSAGIAGNEDIPGIQLTKTSTERLMPEIEGGTLELRIGPSLAMRGSQDGAGDLLNSSSSRGVHGSLGIVKPDVAAPGTSILSAASGGGDAGHVLTGTSMATPHVAGIAALVRSAHPEWTAPQVKAAIMNTATHDVWTEPEANGVAYGPERVGSGRVDALNAVRTDVIAYATQDELLTSVAFGVIDVADEVVTKKATVTVRNFGDEERVLDATFVESSTAGDASITVSPASVRVPAGGKPATVTLTLTVDPETLEREIDPTQDAAPYGLDREFVSMLTGRLVLTGDGQELRVPVQAAPRLVSDLKASKVAFQGTSTTAGLTLTGRGVDAGGWTSLTSPLILAATSPRLEADAGLTTSKSAIASADLRYVGWSSNAPYVDALGEDDEWATLNIGIATDGDWASIGQSVIPVIDIDVDNDGEYDLQSIVTKYDPDIELTTVQTYDLRLPDEDSFVDEQVVNGVLGIDNGLFDSNVLVAPIGLKATGIAEGDTPTVSVWTYSDYARDGVVDYVAPFTVDPYTPPFWFETDPMWLVPAIGEVGTIGVHRSATAKTGKLLVLQHHNVGSARAQVVDVTVPVPAASATKTTTKLAVSGGTAYGKKATLTATVSPAAAGKVTFYDGTKSLGTASVSGGKATKQVALGVGTHQLKAVFAPSSKSYAGSTSSVVKVTVKKSTTTTTVSMSAWTVKKGTAPKATVTVKGATSAPAGKVTIKKGSKVIGTGTLKVSGTTGKVTITLPKNLAVGKHTLTVSYAGNATTAASSKTVTLTVKK